MPRRGASVTQADIARALRAAQAAGPKWYVERDVSTESPQHYIFEFQSSSRET
jgi:hypothetical protein